MFLNHKPRYYDSAFWCSRHCLCIPVGTWHCTDRFASFPIWCYPATCHACRNQLHDANWIVSVCWNIKTESYLPLILVQSSPQIDQTAIWMCIIFPWVGLSTNWPITFSAAWFWFHPASLFKDLGVIFQSELSFKNHIAAKINKAHAILGIIKTKFS